ncbi:MAG: NADP-dependent oxidoreductase [Myxococcota bacterium]|nr:NADP-dependent oxidoreductase [Myxococcota bacterium]
MANQSNRRVLLARRPDGPLSRDCFQVETSQCSTLEDGQLLIEANCLSIDAFIRTVMYEEAYHGSVPVGGTLVALGVGRVLESRSPEFEAGDGVFGPIGAQTHAVVPASLFRKVDESVAPLRAWVGALGVTTGLTAYFGIRAVGCVQPGETVVVSAAAGAVGSVAAQIARIDGGRVIGIAGGPDKCRFLTEELGLDGAVDYKSDDVEGALRELAPDGVDVYFDNVGGELLDVVLDQIREKARIVICGAISQYESMESVRGPSLYLRLAERHARMEGFAVNFFETRYGEAQRELSIWLKRGELVMHEHVFSGIDQFPEALLAMFSGGHRGKLIVEP